MDSFAPSSLAPESQQPRGWHYLRRVVGDLGRRLRHRRLERPLVWFDPRYRLPMASVEATTGIEPRRADLVLSYLVDRWRLAPSDIVAPARISYADLALVHDRALLDELQEAETLARVFAVDAADIHVDEVLATVRLACGGTLEAARQARAQERPMLNLLGGFHHAEPRRASGLCLVNDIAVAVAALRREGFAGRVCVLDLDAHPPDGTARCLEHDDQVWIGSISGSDWGPLPRVDETVLAAGSGDEVYLTALKRLLERMPAPDLAFVIAGGDVLAGDRMGALGLTLAGARERDLLVRKALDGIGSVWLPGGGYHADAWRVLAGTALAIGEASRDRVSSRYDAVRSRFARIAATLAPSALGQDALSFEDVLSDLGVGPRGGTRVLGYYTAGGIEYALERYGILDLLRRLGYDGFEVAIGNENGRSRIRLHAQACGARHLLIEAVLERRRVAGSSVLYVHWLMLQDAARCQRMPSSLLPGQEHPGLGLAKELGELFARMAARLELAGVAFTPSWYHLAYVARRRCRFVDAARQGRFEALVRDLGQLPLAVVTRAMAEGRVRMNGEPYTWEADDMVNWLVDRPDDRTAVRRERARVTFTMAPVASG
jgi:acetoin utilization deacetylase AcuC-like enzyme